MSKIDFQHFKIFLDITHELREERDVRKEIADAIYKNMNGVVAHDVALRIYHTSGPTEFNEEELNLIKSFSLNGTPIFQDSLIENIVD